MTDPPPNSPPEPVAGGGVLLAPSWRGRREIAARLARLAIKELRETLRDRRTIVTLVVMPLVLYPLLALVLHRFLFTSLTGEGPVEYVMGVDTLGTEMRLERQLHLGGRILDREHTGDANGDASSPSGEARAEPKIMLGLLRSDEGLDAQQAAVRAVTEADVHLAILPKRTGPASDADRP